MPDDLATRGFDGSNAGVGGEVLLVREPPYVTHDPEDLRCQNRSYAEDLGEGGPRSSHLLPDALVQRGDLPIEGAHIAHQL
jgi:hypothetical protein